MTPEEPATPEEPVRLLLAEDQVMIRQALAALLEFEGDIEVVAQVGRGDEILKAAEAVLAWCLREAVTNVIRHSGARHCRIRLTERTGELSLEVTDDGRGFAGQNPGTPDNPEGSGLHGVSERLSAVGGSLSLGPADAGHGFRLIATVPAEAATGGTAHNCQL